MEREPTGGSELGLQLHSMAGADKFERAFKEAIKAGSAAIAVTQNVLMSSTNQKQLVPGQ